MINAARKAPLICGCSRSQVNNIAIFDDTTELLFNLDGLKLKPGCLIIILV